MNADQVRTLLIELDALAGEVEQAEWNILGKAKDRLLTLTGTKGSEAEIQLLKNVIRRAQTALRIDFPDCNPRQAECTSKYHAIGDFCLDRLACVPTP